MTGRVTLLALRPPTPERNAHLCEKLGLVDRVIALDSLPPHNRLRSLLSLAVRPRAVLAVEADNAGDFLPLLQAMACLMRAERRATVEGETVQPLSLARGLIGLARVGFASLANLVAMARLRRDASRLLRLPRQDVHCGSGRRVLYINPTPWRGIAAGGAVAHTTGVVNGLTACGWVVRAHSAVGSGLFAPTVEERALPTLAASGMPAEANVYRHHHRVAARLAAEPGPYAFVYQRLTLGTFPAVAAARRLCVPLVLEYNGSEVWISRNWGNPLRFERLASMAEEVCLRHASLIVCVSAPLKVELIARGIDPARIVVCPNGVDAERFAPETRDQAALTAIRRGWGITDDAIVITFVGTFGRWHGAEILAAAFAHLVDTDPDWVQRRKPHLLFIGDGMTRVRCDEILAAPRYRPFVTFTGMIPQDAAPDSLALSQILVSPHRPNDDSSAFFGSPTKLFEYMAAGRPIIASKLDQIGEILAGSPDVASAEALPVLDSESCAILCRPGDVEELARAIRLVVDNPDWAARLGSNARQRCLARHTWRQHVADILSALGIIELEGSPRSHSAL